MCCYFVVIYVNILHILMVCIKCSIIETFLPTDLLVSKYCPETALCPFKESHSMCQNNIPFLRLADTSQEWEVQFISTDDYCKFQHDFGESCYDKQVNITMHPDLASQILLLMNAMRSKVAKGKEISKSASYSGESFRLPRGYSMWKLEWDSELATFAQIWANQCLAKYDVCHASEKFPFATQIIHDLKFDRRYSNELGDIKPEELGWAINVMFKSIYETKNKHKITNSVTHLCLLRCGEPLDRVYNYLQIINGANTHVGCGLSLSRIRENSDIAVKTLQWRLLLICNFSHRIIHMQPLYTIVKPESNHSGLSYSPCGCPTGSIETPDCLCEIQKRKRCKGHNCSLKHSIASKNGMSVLGQGFDGAIVEAKGSKHQPSAVTMLLFGPDIRLNRTSSLGRRRRINSIYAHDKDHKVRVKYDDQVIHPEPQSAPERTTRTSIFLIPQPFRLYKSNIRKKKSDDPSETATQFTNLHKKDPEDKENKLLDFVNEVEGNLRNTLITEDTKALLTKKVKRMQYITEKHANGVNKEKRYDKDLMKNIHKYNKLNTASKQNNMQNIVTMLSPRTTRTSLFLKAKSFAFPRNLTENYVTYSNQDRKNKRKKTEDVLTSEDIRENQIVEYVSKLEGNLRNAQLTEDTRNIIEKKIKIMKYLVDKPNSNNENSDADNQEIELLENFVNIHNNDDSE